MARADADELFTALYQEHYTSVRNYVQKRIMNRDTANDLAQTTFMRFYENMGRLGPTPTYSQPHFIGWLYQTAHNLTVDYIRRQRMHHQHTPPTVPDNRIVHTQSFVSLEMLDLQTAGEPHELELELLDAKDILNRLPLDYALILVQFYYLGYRSYELAHHYHKTNGAMRSHLMRARAAANQIANKPTHLYMQKCKESQTNNA